MAAEEVPHYNSPKRCLAHAFRLSRDRWKRKAADRLATIRSWRVRIRDLVVSRDLWKRKALYYQDLLRQAGRLPAADLLPSDAFAPVSLLPDETPNGGGQTGVAEAATCSPAGAPVPPAPAAEGSAALEPASAPAAPPPPASGGKKKRAGTAVDA